MLDEFGRLNSLLGIMNERDCVDKELYAAKLDGLNKDLDAAKEELKFLRSYCAGLERRFIPADEPRLFPSLTDVAIEKLAYPHEFYRKKARSRVRWNGMSAEQAMYLEVRCLSLLSKNDRQLDGRRHFPLLIATDLARLEITMSHVGASLPDLERQGKVVVVSDLQIQVESIVQTMQSVGIVHLDMHGSGKNIGVSEDGVISLFDFDIATIDDWSMSRKIEKRLKGFQASGGYPWLRRKMHEILEGSPSVQVERSTA